MMESTTGLHKRMVRIWFEGEIRDESTDKRLKRNADEVKTIAVQAIFRLFQSS